MFGCFGQSECVFCSATPENGFSILYQDDSLIALHDRSPGAKFHALVIPRDHITTVKALDRSHVPLLQKMIQVGHELLKTQGYTLESSQVRLGFHVSPFNSVQHLHLHVLGLPFHSRFRQWKYTPDFIWFTEVECVLKRLQEGLSPV